MNYLKVVFLAFFFLGFNSLNAQEATGKWLIVNAFATDATGNTDVAETAALMNDFVNNNIVEYEFTDSIFTIIINGNQSGSCGYTFAPYDETSISILFDANGASLSDQVSNLKGISISETNLHLQSDSPDSDSQLKFQIFLTKQP